MQIVGLDCLSIGSDWNIHVSHGSVSAAALFVI